MKHTPGPWHLNKNIVCANVQSGTVSVETPIADVCSTGAERWKEEEEANAHLISAAPDLLEALEEAQRHLEYIGFGDAYERQGTEPLKEQIEEAIAKARGL